MTMQNRLFSPVPETLVNQAANDAEFSPSSKRHQRIYQVFQLTSENFYIGSWFYERVNWFQNDKHGVLIPKMYVGTISKNALLRCVKTKVDNGMNE